MDTLQRLGIPLPIATGALGLIIALIAGMGLFGRKNQMPVDGRVRGTKTINSSPKQNNPY